MTNLNSVRFAAHHVSISVRDLDASIGFYSLLGFKVVLRWTSKDRELMIVHLRLGETLLEFHAYAHNRQLPLLEMSVGNETPTLGVRHFGLQVDDLARAREFFVSAGYAVSELKHGRTGIDFFYVRDPDGNWVEIVHDAREFTDDNIIEIHEGRS